ncbi:hypothetical protein J6590_071762 [Homalodisca vitripennis]|nr:hypothetical protein J6590_071762 [Homalodisca vitripennis]
MSTTPEGGMRLDLCSTGLQAYEALPSEVGAKLFNKLPLDLRVENRKPLFKRKLRRLLVQGAYYSVAIKAIPTSARYGSTR